MLLILIPIAWLAIVMLVLATCMQASRSDSHMFAAAAETARAMSDSSAMSSTTRATTDGGHERAYQRRRPGPAGQAPSRPRRRTTGAGGSVRTDRGSRSGIGAR